jgi:hypothetical protein
MLPAWRLEFMIIHLSSLGFNFHMLVDFQFIVSFPHIFSVQYLNSIQTSWFSLMRYESQSKEETIMQSGIDTRISMLSPPVSVQSTFCNLKNQIKTKLECWGFWFKIDLIAPKRWSGKHFRIDGVVKNLTHHFHLGSATSCVWQIGITHALLSLALWSACYDDM